MQKRSELTRQALVRAATELIANGRLADAGLVNICRIAGVSRGALYHHFSSTAELVAEVYAQAHSRTAALAEDSFEGSAAGAPARFSAALGTAMSEDRLVRAGMRLSAEGSEEPPWLRDELLDRVHAKVVEGARHGGETGARGPSDTRPEDLADLAVVVTAGLESLGYTDVRWWDPRTARRIWAMVLPLFGEAVGTAETDASGSASVRADGTARADGTDGADGTGQD
ncbi:TetR/AcrR family transcriptional regulator [Streptomyces sp. H27-G5]|uniref:TetR/AcrR family transcriptional regulator n=1 Tax=Streptomyces sp. H27-G5 TaxID=2996698 RepID=UPI00226ED616|nr:TetR/AcrR family transcriptional regulator [Streptomyces sp. H27-G5]MCY0920585.1 TetR/AcrR family transcriptional regulator [Streptomyces sp. H27-G5]